MAKAEVGDAMIPGTHGSTFGGNPLAMRSANAVLELLLEKDFLDNLRKMIVYFDKKMDQLIKNDMHVTPIIFSKKGSGMLRGFQLNENVTAGDFGNTQIVQETRNLKKFGNKKNYNLVPIILYDN